MNLTNKYVKVQFKDLLIVQNPYTKKFHISLKCNPWPILAVDSVIAGYIGMDVLDYYNIAENSFKGQYVDDELIFHSKKNVNSFVSFITSKECNKLRGEQDEPN